MTQKWRNALVEQQLAQAQVSSQLERDMTVCLPSCREEWVTADHVSLVAPYVLYLPQKQAVFEVYANKIQKSYRAHRARQEAKELKRIKMEALAYTARM